MHRRPPLWVSLTTLAITLLVSGRGGAVDVWVTTGDQSLLFSQQPDVVLTNGATGSGISVLIDASQQFQTMEGYGAGLTDSSAFLLQNELNATQRERLLADLFSDEGAGLNYLRLAIGASDFTASGFYTYNDLPAGQTDPSQSQFSIDPDRATILPSLDQIRAVNGDLKLMASPWSPPAWMKTNGSLIGGSLRPEFQLSYAIYLKKFVEAYEAEGHPIDALTLQNEPLFTPGDYPGSFMSAVDQIALVKNFVGPLFQQGSSGTKLLAYDHNWDEPNYPIAVLNDPDARQYLAGTAFHGYAGNVSAQTTVRDAHPDKSIYFTEITGGDFAPVFGDNLMFYAQNLLIGGANNWGSTVLLWNLALDENSGPHQGGCDDCRGVVTIDSTSGDVTYNEEFYALAHAARFVQPGAVRIASTPVNNLVETVAFENPDGSRALLAVNPTNHTLPIRAVENGQEFRYELPARSLATFSWTPGEGADFDNGGFESGGFDTTGGSLDGWLAWGVTGDNVTASNAAALEGDHALRLAEPASANGFSGVSHSVTVSGGDRVLVDASVLLPDVGSIAGAGNSLFMKIEFYDAFDGQFQGVEFLGQTEILVADGSTATGSWLPHQIDTVAPEGAVEARLVFSYARNQTDAGIAFVDDVSFLVFASPDGDYNQDGVVTAADYAVWRDGGSEDSSQAGYEAWAAGFGATTPSPATSAAQTVPEPTTTLLWLTAFTAAFLCSKRRG